MTLLAPSDHGCMPRARVATLVQAERGRTRRALSLGSTRRAPRQISPSARRSLSTGAQSSFPVALLVPPSPGPPGRYLKQCRDIFNIDPFDKANPLPNTNWTNTFYGSTALADPNVVLPNGAGSRASRRWRCPCQKLDLTLPGSIDPWHILGILPEAAAKHPGQLAIYINGTAHCA